ncbi:acetyltransferase [Colletotrichum somersetense]|nr:acetyltransferase [Colletotrichum somersetense]
MAFIRPYKPSDFDATGHICRATLPPSLQRSEAATRTAPYLWTHQYTLLSPSTCHVLDDGRGTAVGYCIGCPNVEDLAAAYPRYVAEVLETSAELAGRRPRGLEAKAPWNDPETGEVDEEALLQQAFKAEWLVLDEDRAGLWGGWRATMHIDLLEPWQGKGWGRRLIERFVESLREADRARGGGDGEEGGERLYGKGVHIGVGGENDKVVPFYEKLGFRVQPTGDKGSSIWMTRDIE